MESFVPGMPGVRTLKTATPRIIFRQGDYTATLAGGKQINGLYARDVDNTGDPNVLRVGYLLGKRTADGYYGGSVIGLLNGALTGTGATATLSAAAVAELVRRQGASGTFTLTGPATAGGPVRSTTVTYSAASGTTATITPVGANEVQQINFNIASTAGAVTLSVPKANGQMITTTAANWSATDATYIANIQTVLDAATGVAGGIVVSAIPATDMDLGFVLTYSGVGYAGLPQPLAAVVVMPTSSTTWTISRTTAGSNGAFVTGSIVGPTDGSQFPIAFVSDWDPYGINVFDSDGITPIIVPMPALPIAGVVITKNLINYPADAASKLWVQTQLSTLIGGKYVFDSTF